MPEPKYKVVAVNLAQQKRRFLINFIAAAAITAIFVAKSTEKQISISILEGASAKSDVVAQAQFNPRQ